MVDKTGFSQRAPIYGGHVRLMWIAGRRSNWIMRGRPGQKSIELCWRGINAGLGGWVILDSTVLPAINIRHYQLTIGGKKCGCHRAKPGWARLGQAVKKFCETGTFGPSPHSTYMDSCASWLNELNPSPGIVTGFVIISISIDTILVLGWYWYNFGTILGVEQLSTLLPLSLPDKPLSFQFKFKPTQSRTTHQTPPSSLAIPYPNQPKRSFPVQSPAFQPNVTHL